MKPRAGWVIADGGASARREDGVTAGFHFLGKPKPYGVQRPYQSPRRGKSLEFLRAAGSLAPRAFKTLHQAMEAADQQWQMN